MQPKLIALFIVILVAAGCAQAPAEAPLSSNTPPPAQDEAPASQVELTTPTQVIVEVIPNTPEPTTTSIPPVQSSNDPCDIPYYPIVDGATWTYTNNSIGQFTHTLNVSDDQIFIIQVSGTDTLFNIEGQCSEDGLVIMNTGLTTTAQGSDGAGSVTTINQDGLTLPNDIQVGDEWSQTIAYSAGSGGEISFSGTIETVYKAVGYESIAVPAGTFEALKIIQTTTMTIEDSSFDTSSNLWYVQGVGNVKTEQITLDGQPSVSELVSYNIP